MMHNLNRNDILRLVRESYEYGVRVGSKDGEKYEHYWQLFAENNNVIRRILRSEKINSIVSKFMRF